MGGNPGPLVTVQGNAASPSGRGRRGRRRSAHRRSAVISSESVGGATPFEWAEEFAATGLSVAVSALASATYAVQIAPINPQLPRQRLPGEPAPHPQLAHSVRATHASGRPWCGFRHTRENLSADELIPSFTNKRTIPVREWNHRFRETTDRGRVLPICGFPESAVIFGAIAVTRCHQESLYFR